MQSTSNEYKQAVYAPDRETKGRVTFDISDVTARNDVSNISVSQQSVISNKVQLINQKREQSVNIATWEKDRFKLDGSFSFADDNIENNGELGFVSDYLCNDEGVFELEPTLTFAFGEPHSSMGITITFDPLNEEYATEFVINAYDGFDNLILSEHVEDNELSQVATIGQFFLYEKIEIIIKKWSKPYRRCRVVEVDFGIVKVYTDKHLIKMDLIEDMDIVTKTLASGEFNFTVENLNKEFNILNPDGFHKFLQERQIVMPEIGVVTDEGIEYVPLGRFYLMDWTSDEGALTASFTARNIIDIMTSYDYENLTAKNNYSLYQMAVDIFEICGVVNYEIDPALQNIETKGLVKKSNCRDVLQLIAIAGMCNVHVTREGKLIIRQSPLGIGDKKDTVSLNDMYDEPKIELEKITKSVEVTYYDDLDTPNIYIKNNQEVKEGANIKVSSNTLINTEEKAINVANWIMRMLNYRAIYDVNWRGNPAHELNDVVVIEDAYNLNKESIVTKIELTYQGALEGKLGARGMIE